MPGPDAEVGASPSPSPADFRRVLGRFATGVGVMTTVADGRAHGMTANAVTSVSLDPPLVLVCVERDALMAQRVADSGVFAITFLAREQHALSSWFADPSRPDDGTQFTGVPTRVAVTGAPIVEGGVGWIDTTVHAVHDGGDHLIVVGRVRALGEGAEVDPLLYYRSAYRWLDDQQA